MRNSEKDLNVGCKVDAGPYPFVIDDKRFDLNEAADKLLQRAEAR